jgi:hypothetical protein
MPVTEFDPRCGDQNCGLDFAEFFHHPDLVRKALDRFKFYARPAACYCLEFQCIDETPDSYFAPYKSGIVDNGFLDRQQYGDLPYGIPYGRLVRINDRPKDDQWPLIGQWWPLPGSNSEHPDSIVDAQFHGLVRLQAGSTYVGYYKAAWHAPATAYPSFESALANAYAKVQTWLYAEVEKWRWDRTRFDENAQKDLKGIHDLLEILIQANKYDRAIQVVSELLTSHLGARLNRVACLAPRGDACVCLYAHGGNCTDDFSNRVQYPISTQVHSLHDLYHHLRNIALPTDDPLFAELCADKDVLILEDIGSSNSILAQLIRDGGNLSNWFGSQAAVETQPDIEVNFALRLIVDQDPEVVALKLEREDPLLATWASRFPGSAWNQNRASKWYALPFRYKDALLAVFVVDVGYWENPSERQVIIPRLMVASAVLNEFAPHFFGADLAR